ncbi:3-deoxy-D-manno-octulosonic acid transferase [Cetobacterium sp. 8H]|uniref:3-deoxy-D-manno-octulosonic acid transferase n=1 Tax=Cetobacterium sp. 8H TaxID=2759681 RepID=UPI00163BAD8B|nr:3-deoxy-D-manno-octulosonic acid transferase [Cetobacterium sp. 8H]MBC2850543.1 3-deoxy-D-manno-octulosonic acid transferase [Cetobacterium sp. 8H]
MFYNLLRAFIYPFLFVFLIFKPKKLAFVLKRFFQDFSCLKKGEKYIWIHCSSVGEINLSDSLIKKIESTYKENLLITVFTDTGFEIAKNKYSNNSRIDILRFPLDDIFIIKRILSLINVSYLILVETEIWPNLINMVSKKGKVILVNGRISNKSYPRYKRLVWLLKPLFKNISKFCMQSEIDQDRIISLGAKKENVFTTGNLKFDISFEEFSDSEKNSLKNQLLLGNRKLFVAGSTREGEDQIIIDVFKKLTSTLLVIVPRHLERVNDIENLLRSSGLTFSRFSSIEDFALTEKIDVIIVDKMGILRKFYSICDIAFVGGTLVNIGGHSLLEPLFYGKTPIFGPYLQNVKDISRDICNLKLGYKVSDEIEFLNAINYLEANPVSKNKIYNFFKSNKNAVEKIVKLMEE